MNFKQITSGKALRVSVNGKAVTLRKKYNDIIREGHTPESYVEETLQNLGIDRCVVEVFRPNGSSMLKEGQFYYSLNGQPHKSHTQQVDITLSTGVAGIQISLNGQQVEIQLSLQNKQNRR